MAYITLPPPGQGSGSGVGGTRKITLPSLAGRPTFGSPPPTPTPKKSPFLMDKIGQFGERNAPGTMDKLKEIQKDPLSLKGSTLNPLKLFGQYISDIKDSFVSAYNSVNTGGPKTPKDFGKQKPTAESIGRGLEALPKVVGAGISPLSSLFSAAEKVPVLGTIAKGISAAFSGVGELAGSGASSLLDKIPDKTITNAFNIIGIKGVTRETLRPGLKEIVGLAAQIAAGKALDVAAKVGLPSERAATAFRTDFETKYPDYKGMAESVDANKINQLVKDHGAQDAQTIVKKAIDISRQKAGLAAIPDRPQNVPITDNSTPGEVRVKNITLPPPEAQTGEPVIEYKRITTTAKPTEQIAQYDAALQSMNDHFSTMKDDFSPLEKYATKGPNGLELPQIDHDIPERFKNMSETELQKYPKMWWRRFGDGSFDWGVFDKYGVTNDAELSDAFSKYQQAKADMADIKSKRAALNRGEVVLTDRGIEQINRELQAGNDKISQLQQDQVPPPTQENPSQPANPGGPRQVPAEVKPKAQATAQEQLSNQGNKVSGVARSVEAKAIEGKLTNGFENLAGYESSTFKEEARKTADLINTDVAKARAMVRGEVPTDIKAAALFAGLEDYAKLHPEEGAAIMQEMGNSPLASKISTGASETSFARMREPDSATAKLHELKKSLEEKAGGKEKVAKERKSLVAETKKVNLPKEDLAWNKFLDSIEC